MIPDLVHGRLDPREREDLRQLCGVVAAKEKQSRKVVRVSNERTGTGRETKESLGDSNLYG